MEIKSFVGKVNPWWRLLFDKGVLGLPNGLDEETFLKIDDLYED